MKHDTILIGCAHIGAQTMAKHHVYDNSFAQIKQNKNVLSEFVRTPIPITCYDIEAPIKIPLTRAERRKLARKK